MTGKYIIDRIEEDIVIAEDDKKNILEISKKLIQGQLKEGSVLIEENCIFKVSSEDTDIVKNKVSQKMKGMWQE